MIDLKRFSCYIIILYPLLSSIPKLLKAKDIKIVFFGTSEFAVASLDLLSFKIIILFQLLVTIPDKNAGRGQKIQFSPVKKYALEKNLNAIATSKFKRREVLLNALHQISADLQIVIAFQDFTGR